MDVQTAVETCAALATPSRLSVLKLLASAGKDGMPSGKIAEQLGVTQSTLSTQLFLLARARLVRYKREKQSKIYSVNPDAIRDLIGFLIEDCAGGRVKGVRINA